MDLSVKLVPKLEMSGIQAEGQQLSDILRFQICPVLKGGIVSQSYPGNLIARDVGMEVNPENPRTVQSFVLDQKEFSNMMIIE